MWVLRGPITEVNEIHYPPKFGECLVIVRLFIPYLKLKYNFPMPFWHKKKKEKENDFIQTASGCNKMSKHDQAPDQWSIIRPSQLLFLFHFYYLTRAVSSPTSDPGKAVLGPSVVLSFCHSVSCPGLFREFGVSSSFLPKVQWTACQNKHAHKYTKSDNCRLQVCSFEVGKPRR